MPGAWSAAALRQLGRRDESLHAFANYVDLHRIGEGLGEIQLFEVGIGKRPAGPVERVGDAFIGFQYVDTRAMHLAADVHGDGRRARLGCRFRHRCVSAQLCGHSRLCSWNGRARRYTCVTGQQVAREEQNDGACAEQQGGRPSFIHGADVTRARLMVKSAEANSMRVVLTPMSADRGAEFEEMFDEFRAAGESHAYGGHQAIAVRGYAAYYDLLCRMKNGGYPTPDIVPMDSYFIESEGQILGELHLRHSLSPALEELGGHIGYRVRPSARNRGVATAALRLALHRAHSLGLEQALITCDDANLASARVIEKCGGVRTDNSIVQGRAQRRYWVPTYVKGFG